MLLRSIFLSTTRNLNMIAWPQTVFLCLKCVDIFKIDKNFYLVFTFIGDDCLIVLNGGLANSSSNRGQNNPTELTNKQLVSSSAFLKTLS